MSNAERLKLALEMTQESLPYLFAGPPEVVKRRFELLNKQNNERNRRMLEAFARSERQAESTNDGTPSKEQGE